MTDGRVVVAALGLCFGATALAAQSTPAIRSAIQLASEGRADSARHLLEGELARSRTGDSTWIEALYWRARLAPAGEAADRDLRRIVIEFGNSPWADDALLQLTQLAIAAGNPAAALDYTARLRSDYPGSELRPRAALWGGRAAFDVGEPRTACALLDSARAEGSADVEFENQVTFYRSRCTAEALAAPPARPARTDSTPLVPRPTPPAVIPETVKASAPHGFEVQVVAAKSRGAANAIVTRLARAHLRARVVAASGIYRVRMGPYATNAAADSAAHGAKRAAGGSPFVVRLP